MFQFTCLPHTPYGFRHAYARITTRGFPHSDIPGSEVGQHLLRAYRSRPRPSSAPSAKASTVCPSSLDHEEHRVCRYGVFKVRANGNVREDRRTRSLKTQQRSTHEVDVRSRRVRHRTDSGRSRAIKRADACRSNSSGIPRKEVIQPQLPLRLPCYDFTPITNPPSTAPSLAGWATGFGCCRLSWCDGRCVQGPGTYSPRHC